MRLLKYLFLFIALLFTSKTFASCPYPATFNAISAKPFPTSFCYPESNGGEGFCEFVIYNNGMDIKVPCTNPNGCGSEQKYAIDVKSVSNKVYKNSDCTNPPLEKGCTQLPDGSIECKEETEEPDSPILECTTDSCLNPQNKRCPTGYTTGSFNGQSMCVKSKTENPEDPTQCTGEDCGIRTDRIVSAVDKANLDITNSVDNLGSNLDSPLSSIKDFLSQISDKLSAITDKIGSSSNPETNPETNPNVDTSSLNADLPVHSTDSKQIDSQLFSSNAQCPQSSSLSLPQYGIYYEFSFTQICDFLNWLSYLVMISAYATAIYIVVKA